MQVHHPFFADGANGYHEIQASKSKFSGESWRVSRNSFAFSLLILLGILPHLNSRYPVKVRGRLFVVSKMPIIYLYYNACCSSRVLPKPPFEPALPKPKPLRPTTPPGPTSGPRPRHPPRISGLPISSILPYPFTLISQPLQESHNPA